MATLILGAIGGVVGGRIGQAVGAAIGSVVDGAIFAPAPRQGPRLTDVSVQTSSYGTQIPKVFGRARVAGTVIWATDLIETRTRRSNGKGRGSTDIYSYSASFAVLLSGRRISQVGRIWADGKLLRGEAGDLKTELAALRVHVGHEDQVPDPLIAAVEGDDAPAYRGAAYVVFEGLQLADYGNRIPSLTLEVIADAAPVGIGAAISELAGVSSELGPSVTGMVASGTDVRTLAETLAEAFPASVRDAVPAIVYATPIGSGVDSERLGASVASPAARVERRLNPADAVSASLVVGYSDPERDYQAGTQRAFRAGPGGREARLDLPLVLASGAAAVLGESVVGRWATERETATISLPWSELSRKPGDAIRLNDREWRITARALESMCVRLDLVRRSPSAVPPRDAEPGRPISEVDAPHGPTVFDVVDLPPMDATAATRPAVTVFACGTGRGWRRASVLASADRGASFSDAGTIEIASVMATTLVPLGPGSTAIVDDANSVDIQTVDPTAVLFDADDAMLLAGANTVLLGGEVIQFGRAQPLGGGRWRLGKLLRGRRGTEDSTAHGAGSTMVLLEPGVGLRLAEDLSVPGVVTMAGGIGEPLPWTAKICATAARAVMPLSPVHLRAVSASDGTTELLWVRRSREGWAWRDGVDVPLAEDREVYRVSWLGNAIDLVTPRFVYSASMRATDIGSGHDSVTFSVVQVGTFALSPPATITLSLI